MTGSVAVPFTLVSSARTGFTSVLSQTSDPYDDPTAPDYAPSIVWHWRATVPRTIADWIVMYSSIVLHVSGPTQFGLLDSVQRGYFYDGDPNPADGDGYGAVPFVYLDTPVTLQNGPWFLFDQASADISNWEEMWLTECFTAGPPFYPTARSGPQFYWTDPQWRASINNHNGFLSYLVAPFPTTVDYWLVTPSYWVSNGRKIDANYVVLDSRLIIISCQPTSTVSGAPGAPGLLCHDGPLGVGVGGPVQNRYSLRDLVYLAASVGCFANVPVAASVAMAESGGDPLAQGENAGPPPSVDRGLWQINSVAHPDVSDVCAFNPVCNAKAACAISNGGTDWTPWTTYNTGAYLTYLAAATAIFNAMG